MEQYKAIEPKCNYDVCEIDLENSNLKDVLNMIVDFYKQDLDGTYELRNHREKITRIRLYREVPRTEMEELLYKKGEAQSVIYRAWGSVANQLNETESRKQGLKNYKRRMMKRKINGVIDSQMMAKYQKKKKEFEQRERDLAIKYERLRQIEKEIKELNENKEI